MAVAVASSQQKLIEIDGSKAGGQLLRSALTLSLCTQKPFRIIGLRSERLKPGLLRQHLTVLQAAAALAKAEVSGATLGSQELSFQPLGLRGGSFAYSVGGAANSMLFLQTLLLPLALSGAPSELILEGSTHTGNAPSVQYIEHAYLPLLRSMGLEVQIRVERMGFSKSRLGRVLVSISPSRPQRFSLLERGDLKQQEARVIIAAAPRELAERELLAVKRSLRWPQESYVVEELPAEVGPANVVILTLVQDNLTEVFAAVGERGLKGDALAERALQDASSYLSTEAALGPYLAEQLLVPAALAGGAEFSCSSISENMKSTMALVQQFLPVVVHCQPLGSGGYMVRINS